jgi:hypothetical protein
MIEILFTMNGNIEIPPQGENLNSLRINETYTL